MSLSDLAEPSSSSSSSASSSYSASQTTTPPTTRISLTVPTSLLILPPTAAFIGLSIGLARGGNRSRLRFLAENAHRQPKTIQGWYFYTKTRNYRVFFGAAKTGSKFALGLGGATALYVLLDESIGFIRESIVGVKGEADPTPGGRGLLEDSEKKQRVSWRKGGVAWEDGALAGAIMGVGVGSIYRLPRPLFIRSTIMGTLLGALTSTMQVAQAHIGRLRQEEEAKNTVTTAQSAASLPVTTEEVIPPAQSANTPQEPIIDKRTDTRGAMPVDLIPIDDDEGKGWFSRLRGAIGI
ncbi:uncharacterized protein I303_104265 [Kwoniella dejecticola CBS 10117]|uniref:Uncharacterized protein n=1 Tax=Kwoniella dejecticola CBS 10117 TaxID=1296121 RepID=A0A1A6A5U5_9TREE|nr:uncharacterized protein I303_04758 [Kwoniella dejecticola CBS 10117]OBR85423.1 hypothetical protein I303_04758 [Kwoniella dejecticola CBS 10117]